VKSLSAQTPVIHRIVGAVNFEATEAEKAKQLPDPSGYRILCAIPEVEDKFEGSDLRQT